HRFALGKKLDLIVGNGIKMVDRDRTALDSKPRTAKIRELIDVCLYSETHAFCRTQDPLGLAAVKRIFFREYITEEWRPVLRKMRCVVPFPCRLEHLLAYQIDVAISIAFVLRRDGMSCEKRRHDIDRVLEVEPLDHPEHLEFRFRVKPVTGLDLGGCRPAGEHLIEPSETAFDKLVH